jgi:hypothetical protein
LYYPVKLVFESLVPVLKVGMVTPTFFDQLLDRRKQVYELEFICGTAEEESTEHA